MNAFSAQRNNPLSIVLEGGEGAGKGTVAALLAEALQPYGPVHRTREPGGLPLAEKIRSLILADEAEQNMTPLCEAYLYAASRSLLVAQDILPALHRGEIVLIDRFVYSSYVYQGIVEGVGLDRVRQLNEPALASFTPTFIFYLDIEPEEGLARIAADTQREVNRLDRKNLEFHQKVRKGYLELASLIPSYYILDAHLAPEITVNKILVYLAPYLTRPEKEEKVLYD